MSVNTEDNKLLLIALLLDHPLKKRNQEHFDHILNQELERLHNDRFSYKSNLMLMNKEILKTFQSITNQILSEPVKPVNKAPIQTFENRLKEKQDNFEKMIRTEPPKEIDFTDKIEENYDNELDYTMEKRETELKKIMNSQTKNKNVEAWLNGESNTKPVENNVPNIRIDHSTNVKLDALPIKQEKRVTFAEEKVSNDLFSKLKPAPDSIMLENNQLLKLLKKNF